jgi:hypothetical protein
MMLSSTKESTANPKIPHYLNVCTESLRESKTQQKRGERKKERKKTSLAIVDGFTTNFEEYHDSPGVWSSGKYGFWGIGLLLRCSQPIHNELLLQ